MTGETVTIWFAGSERPPVELTRGTPLAEQLNVLNSPLLFGCRTGLCGTCAVRVEVVAGELPAAGDDEAEVLSLVAPRCEGMRLACQLTACADLRIGRLP